jgi:hypothetical protein
MKRCNHCGGRFGLVRHRHYTLRFCSENCLEAWKRNQRERAQQQRFLEWLNRPDDAAPVPAGPRSGTQAVF